MLEEGSEGKAKDERGWMGSAMEGEKQERMVCGGTEGRTRQGREGQEVQGMTGQGRVRQGRAGQGRVWGSLG